MTREEALKKMQAVKAYMISGNPIWNITEMGETFDMAIEALEQSERKKGKWIKEHWFMNSTDYKYTCSECGAHHRAMYDFCPSCGVDMRGE